MYEIIMRKQALKKLRTLPEKQQVFISQAIEFLALDPDDDRLHITKLGGRSGYRVRVGNWRIMYERDDCLRIISIDKIGPRGDVYK